ncbi:hypothetical protein FACS1894217_09390 [Clostridia bacterium]|nr:hypothetical protein FACS1894217_09390 [Clostridia bacterium]
MLPRLVIRQNLAQISIQSTPAQVQPRVTRMEMQPTKTPGRLDGAGRLAKVTIDQTEAFASAGNKPILRMSSDDASAALQKGLDTIGRIVSEGLQFLRAPQRGAGDVVSQVSHNILSQQMEGVELTVRAMPSASPQIDVIDGDSQMNWTPAELNVEWRHNSVSEGSFVPAQINVTFQHPSIEITLEPGVEFFPVNTGVGKYMDMAT